MLLTPPNNVLKPEMMREGLNWEGITVFQLAIFKKSVYGRNYFENWFLSVLLFAKILSIREIFISRVITVL